MSLHCPLSPLPIRPLRRGLMLFGLAATSASLAQTLPDPAYFVWARAGIDPADEGWAAGPTPLQLAYDTAVIRTHTTAEAQAQAEVHGGTGLSQGRPEAIASAHTAATATPNGRLSSSTQISAAADSGVTYYVAVRARPDAGLVWQPTSIPVLIDLRGEISREYTPGDFGSDAGGRATVRVRNENGRTILFEDTAWYPDLSFQRSASLTVELYAPVLRLDLYAYAYSVAYANTVPGGHRDVSTSAQALADPLFTFDQTAFDLMATSLGRPTFDLTSAFAFEFSPGIANGVIPEPGTWAALAGLVALTIALASRSRTRSRSGEHRSS